MSGPIITKTKAIQLMKEELLKWLCINHATDGLITRPLLKSKALEFVNYYGVKGYKCSTSWLTQFLKRYGFAPALDECRGPVFDDWTTWIDILRPIFASYPYDNQFHLDELPMYSDFFSQAEQESLRGINPTAGSSVDGDDDDDSLIKQELRPPLMHRVSILLVTNVSGTEKLPPIISGPYPVDRPHQNYLYHKNDSCRVSDQVLSEWLRTLNHTMSMSNRRIVLILSRSYVNAVKYANLTHIQPIYLPNNFPNELRPLRRDVYHFIKMSYRSKYVEGLCQSTPKDVWLPEEIIECLADAWRKVSRELLVANFQRTKFREDDLFLNIECPLWESLKIGVSFEKFVKFDDGLFEALDPGNKSNDFKFWRTVSEVDSLRNSFSQDCSNFDSTENSPMAHDDRFDDNLLRPRDDLMDGNSCEPMDCSSACRNKLELSKSQSMTDDNGNDKVFSTPDTKSANDENKILKITVDDTDNVEDTDPIEDWKSAGTDKTVVDLADSDRTSRTVSSAGTDKISEINSPDLSGKNSPIRNASTPSEKNCTNKDFSNRINPSPERTSVCSHGFIADNCFEQFFLNKLTDLDKKYDRFDSDSNKLRKIIYPNDSPIPSTSKEGLEESYALQRFYSESFYNNKIHQLEPTVIKSPRVEMLIDGKSNEEGAGDGGDDINSKRTRSDNENSTVTSTTGTANVCVNVEEPPSKKIKTEFNWAERYQNQYVFGPNSVDYPVDAQTATDIKPTIDGTENTQVEKKSIFTLTDQQFFDINKK
ncbi:uncharacterized protein LOC106693285 isoform X1 [Microplitis demolitor]|uniref:uncharacterized protein LOC106693285 isoform X1 n=2 Tax=Microplitis demolitor TaxID=69319 RepID=UPI00235B5BB7|nr:uncharacterized protein LOC106693285 isoform X1 [Microplitis demolitor]